MFRKQPRLLQNRFKQQAYSLGRLFQEAKV